MAKINKEIHDVVKGVAGPAALAATRDAEAITAKEGLIAELDGTISRLEAWLVNHPGAAKDIKKEWTKQIKKFKDLKNTTEEVLENMRKAKLEDFLALQMSQM
jgi:hypothetical protein